MELLHHNISTYGGGVDELIWLITGFVVFWFAVSFLALIAFSLGSRRKPGVKSTYVKGEGWSQTKWIMIPVVLVTLCDGVIDVYTHDVWETVKGRVQDVKDFKAEEVVEIGIKAQQFGWEFSYDAGADKQFFTTDDPIFVRDDEGTGAKMHVPAGKKIVFHLTAKDVMHSFWVKNLRLKQDAIPGRFILGWFQVDPEYMKTWRGEGTRVLEPGQNPVDGANVVEFKGKNDGKGQRVEVIPFDQRKPLGDNWAAEDDSKRTFEIACAEICGVGHWSMRAWLVVDDQAAFNNWLEKQRANQ